MARKLLVKRNELNLKMMLEGGQCFRWKETNPSEWTGVMSDLLWIIKQFDGHIEYEVFGNQLGESVNYDCHSEAVLSSYLRLHDNVNDYYSDWSSKDCNFKKISNSFEGIRILNQDTTENIFSFICSSNNNIKRITTMIEKLCNLYGNKLIEHKGTTYYTFPSISALSDPSVEQELRKAGFGYRARFINQSAHLLNSLGGLDYLNRLKFLDYETAKKNLMKFPGVGAKVADCVCLMSLGHLQAVPVDTHVFKIASEAYLPHLKHVKSVTSRIYDEIGAHFRTMYGPMAGWAHAVLFCADLKMFKIESEEKKCSAVVNKKRRNRSEIELDFIHQNDMKIEKGSIKCQRNELNLRITLNSGQTYRWTEIEPDVWRGICYSRVWTLKQHNDRVDFESVSKLSSDEPLIKKRSPYGRSHLAKQLLSEYFRLDFPLNEYYNRWSGADKHFNEIAKNFYGLRMIRQNIVENLFAFLCSSNNTIKRMRNMVETMCKNYGDEIATVDGHVYHDFPPVSRLAAENVHKDLVSANFGFRAAYVSNSARYIVENGGDIWIDKLSLLPYESARVELMKLPGVGAKIADCICLTALDHLNTIPVDTHVYQIAAKYYLPHLKQKNPDKKSPPPIGVKVYQEIVDCFKNLFTDYAGWAHTVLFCSDLREHLDLRSSSKD